MFYQLFACLSDSVRKQLRLSAPEDFAYLAQSKCVIIDNDPNIDRLQGLKTLVRFFVFDNPSLRML